MTFLKTLMKQAADRHQRMLKIPKGIIMRFPDSLGDLFTTANVNIPSTLDGDTVFRTYDDLTINSGHTLTTSHRCKGLCVYVRGDCTINGVLSMTARGAHALGSNIIIEPRMRLLCFDATNFGDFPYVIHAAGGAAGLAVSEAGKTSSLAGLFACGGGGAGGRATGGSSEGAAGTSFSGGSGGGARNRDLVGPDHSIAQPNGGQGGNSYNGHGSGYPCGSGAGNPAGTLGHQGTQGQNGTGGMLILVVEGSLTIGATGAVRSNGMNGGLASHGSGGSSGGGNISVFHRGALVNGGVVQAIGGARIGTSNFGGAGGDGAVRIVDLAA
jgi:hypothetical protein